MAITSNNIGSVNHNGSGNVSTEVSAWIENETGSTAVLCVKTKIQGSAGVTGYGIIGHSGYTGNGTTASEEAGRGVINNDAVAVDGTCKWTIQKTHSGWTADCCAKSTGEVVNGNAAYPIPNEVRCSLSIPATTSYTISYDANGGSGAPSNQKKWHGEPLTLSSAVPMKTGYIFKGWGIFNNDTSVDYAAGSTYSTESDITLYAIWELETYTVSYDVKGGTGAPANQIKTYGKTLTISDTIPVKDGYKFLGWSENKTSTTPTYTANGSYTKNKNTVLYAVWEPNKYNVVYDVNGGIGQPNNQYKAHDIALALSATKPVKDKYEFLGWATSFNGDVAYHSGDNYLDNKPVTLYAVWKLSSKIMKSLNGYETYDCSARSYINCVGTSGTSEAYSASVDGITELKAGVSFVMMPHIKSVAASPTLNVNGLGAKNIRRRLSNSTFGIIDSMGVDSVRLAENKPVRVTYDGECWIIDSNKPNASDIYGTVPIQNGGTGADTVAGARNKLGLGNTSGALPIENGGTGAADCKTALNNLGISWGVDAAPSVGKPNSIYIQII